LINHVPFFVSLFNAEDSQVSDVSSTCVHKHFLEAHLNHILRDPDRGLENQGA